MCLYCLKVLVKLRIVVMTVKKIKKINCVCGITGNGDREAVTMLSSVSSAEDGAYVLGKAHMGSTPSLRSFPNVAFETVSVFV